MCEHAMSMSVIGKAMEKGLLEMACVQIRDFATDTYRSVDDAPYGGGPGMVMMPGPIVSAYESLGENSEKHRLIHMTPSGRPFNQELAREWSTDPKQHLVFICGRYEGIDQRVQEILQPEEVSLGDFVLTGGEMASLCMADCVGRLIPGVLGCEASTDEESFSSQTGELEYPHYTRPREYRGHPVPEVLLGGNHREIEDWRRHEAHQRTQTRRPDLIRGKAC